MNTLEPKKLAIIRILQILEEYSDINHPLTQEVIAEILLREYGLTVERKAISRNLSRLREAGYEIESSRAGTYLAERKFEDSELHLLIDGVLSSRHITAKHSKDLIDKLCGLSNKYFASHMKHIHSVNDWNKSENQNLFYNIELIDEAIENSKQVKFDYNKYGTDKKLHKTATHTASPYQLILHNQRYYLMALNERHGNIIYYKVDRITNMSVTKEKSTPIRSVKGYENGIDYSKFSSALPYMFADGTETITFYASEVVVDQIMDWFGNSTKFENTDGKIKVTVKASSMAMEFWAMQYLNYVEILTPECLRQKISDNIKNASEKYV